MPTIHRIALLVLFLAASRGLAQEQVLHAVSGFSEEHPPQPSAMPSTVWIEGHDTPPIISCAYGAAALGLTALWQSKMLHNPPFIFAIFDDGTMYYSKDSVIGGAPYFQRMLSSQEMTYVEDVIESFDSTPNINVTYKSPREELSLHVNVLSGYHRFTLQSAHLFVEGQGALLATSEGYIAAEGRCFEEIAATQPAHFLQYRQAWADALALRDTFDDEQAVLVGDLETDRGPLSLNGEYELGAKFWESRARTQESKSQGGDMSIEELRELYQSVAPLNPTGECE